MKTSSYLSLINELSGKTNKVFEGGISPNETTVKTWLQGLKDLDARYGTNLHDDFVKKNRSSSNVWTFAHSLASYREDVIRRLVYAFKLSNPEQASTLDAEKIIEPLKAFKV